MGAPRELYAPIIKGQMLIKSGIGSLSADDGVISIGGSYLSAASLVRRASKTIAFGDFATSNVTSSVVAFGTAVPADALVLGCDYYVSAVFSGDVSAAMIDIGDGLISQGFAVSANVWVGVSATDQRPVTLGALVNSGGYFTFSAARTPNVKMRVKGSGGNLSSLTQGSVIARVAYVVAR